MSTPFSTDHPRQSPRYGRGIGRARMMNLLGRSLPFGVIKHPNMTAIHTEQNVAGSMAATPQPQHATRERAQHGAEFIAHREAERISNAIQSLHTVGEIGEAERCAAERWLRSYHLGLVGIRRQDLSGVRGNPSFDGFTTARLDALASYKRANAALGSRGVAVLYATEVDGLSLRGLARKLGRDQTYWSGFVAATLYRLADHYAYEDGRQRSVVRK